MTKIYYHSFDEKRHPNLYKAEEIIQDIGSSLIGAISGIIASIIIRICM